MKLSQRGHVDPFIVMDVLERANVRARAGRQVFHLEAGQPGTAAPARAREAAAASLGSEVLGYTEALGRPALRERIARHYLETYGVGLAPERVVVTTGSSAGFLLAFLALFDSGESLAMAVPGYPAYRNIALACGIMPEFLECRAASGFQLGTEALAKASAVRGVLIASPANPTGTMIDEAELARLVAHCRDRDMWLVSDEIYHGITYGARAQTALAFSPDVVVINSFSKYFSMTGWRIGWMVVPEAAVRPIKRLAQNLYISPPAISQVAALAALDSRDELDRHVRVYSANRERLRAALDHAGFATVAPSDGAFYLYADIAPFAMDATTFTRRLLDEAGVAATPGLDFDPFDGERWVRFSYAGGADEVAAASDALVNWCRRNRSP